MSSLATIRNPALAEAPATFRFAFGKMAENWGPGALSVCLPDGRSFRVGGAEPGPEARLIVRDYRFIGRCLTGGDIGFAEGYMAGEWDTPDLADLLELFSLNFERIRLVSEGGALSNLINLFSRVFQRNSKKGARRNIEAHYDLGNDFYQAWLDPSMTYSSALYRRPDDSLQDAQSNKYAALAETIGLAPEHEVLEIGCGWGGFAEYAAKTVGARVTGLTLSPAQHDFARRRLYEQGLADKADIRLIDYRDIEGRFDRAVSIEMFEAVGEQYWGAYFNKLAQVLKPGGRAGLQIITLEDGLFEHYRKRTDFIQKYIFPGGMLPSERRLKDAFAAANLQQIGARRFGLDYARTLGEWAERFTAAWPRVKAQGFDERFQRMWRFYLAYCEAGFRTRRTDVVQFALQGV
jgi:cyclopropane-fatty-acyl-phospholipid synthase